MKLTKRIFAFLIIIIMCFNLSVYCADFIYTDVYPNDWYYNNILRLNDLNIINGYDNFEFRPNNKMRANEFIKLVISAIGEDIDIRENESWDAPYIRRAEQIGIVYKNIVELHEKTYSTSHSYSENHLSGKDELVVKRIKIIDNYNNYITREQVAAIISNALAYKSIDKFREHCEWSINYCIDSMRWFDLRLDLEISDYLLNLGIEKIFFNILYNRENNDVDVMKFKYSRAAQYTFYSNSQTSNGYSKEKSFVNINTLDYDYTYKYVPSLLKDFSKIDDLYKYDVIDVYISGIMQGSNGGLFKPKDTITRAEVATIILRYIFESERLSYTINGAKSFVYSDGNKLVAPPLKGKPVNEVIDICDLVNKAKENTLGIEIINVGKSSFNLTGFENYETYKEFDDYWQNMNPDNFYLLQYKSYLKNFEFTIDFESYTNKYGPYMFHFKKYWYYVKDSEFQGKDIGMSGSRILTEYPKTYDEFFNKYYGDTLYGIFKYLFEEEVDRAWDILTAALKQYDNMSLDLAKSITIEKIINNRTVIFRYNDQVGDVLVNISLKNK